MTFYRINVTLQPVVRKISREYFQVEILWDVTPCSEVVGYQRFRAPCCFHSHFTLKMASVRSSETLKVKLPLCLTKHHSMKAYWGVEV
jgi:hypothetical protein